MLWKRVRAVLGSVPAGDCAIAEDLRRDGRFAASNGRWLMEFDPFSGEGLDTLELVWEPCIKKFGMAPPLVIATSRAPLRPFNL